MKFKEDDHPPMSLCVLEGCMYPTTQPKRHKADVGCAPSMGGEARRLGGAMSASKGFVIQEKQTPTAF